MAIDNQNARTPVTQVTQDSGFKETVIAINRVTKVVKGGKSMSFRAVTVVGTQMGEVGIGMGKAREVQQAIQKASTQAKKNMTKVLMTDTTIPHEITGRCGAAKVLLKPAKKGTGVISGGIVRAVLEAVGIKDLVSKSLGSSNPLNVAYATMDALKKLRTMEQIGVLLK